MTTRRAQPSSYPAAHSSRGGARHRSAPARLLVALWLAIVGAVLLPAAAAHAHAGLVSARPEDGSVLQNAPERFELTFSEPVSPLRLTLVEPDGTVLDITGAKSSGAVLTLPLPPSLTDGTHLLAWRVVSADGHPVSGSVRFSVKAPSADPPALPPDTDRVSLALLWASRLLLYLGLFFGIGGAAAAFLAGPPGEAGLRRTRLALGLGLIAIPLSLGAQGLDALGASWTALANPAVWRAALDTGYGPTALVAALSLLLAALSTRLGQGAARAATATLALAGAGVALALTGHASHASPQLLTRPAVALHTVAVALWIGALAPLALALRGSEATAHAALRRFSARIAPIVAVLVVTGACLAVIQVGTIPALWRTDYGRVLLAKLGLVALLFALAAHNRWRLTKPVLQGGRSASRAMTRQIGCEIALAALVLGTVALWRFTPPPRVEAAIAAEPAQLHATGGRLMADVTLAPARAGPVEARAMLMTIDYGPVNPQSVEYVFTPPPGGNEPIRVEARNRGDGVWRAEADLPVSGPWSLRVEVRIDAETLDRLDMNLYVRP